MTTAASVVLAEWLTTHPDLRCSAEAPIIQGVSGRCELPGGHRNPLHLTYTSEGLSTYQWPREHGDEGGRVWVKIQPGPP